MDELVELRCKYCGAPLDEKDLKSDSPYVKCQCCGTSQQRVDAKAYMDQMMGEIKSWISKAAITNIQIGTVGELTNASIMPLTQAERFEITTFCLVIF